ncbi:uncharacterized protein TNIN_350661 [Trichonephila inaurata madagascariensis]|uniref:Uncharacterized protein n=1 Tax=Trichonephila inaurata madagascariensis TaxID=2747483 RepID=A0A8X6IJI8_9ARAC|nr:uncharacterized protein TNIN_350661 [Trichonephila inaurata madagascariensis]
MIADIISDVSRPSTNFLRELGEMVQNNTTETNILGTICLSLGYLASKGTPDDQSMVCEILTRLLRERQDSCELNSFFIDILEAIGNLKSDKSISDVLEVSKRCKNNNDVQIACAHAFRNYWLPNGFDSRPGVDSRCCPLASRKRNAEANDIAQNYFGPESEPWDPQSHIRQKRAVWDDLNCQDWTEDSRFVNIQDREEFAADRATYNKRKSCLGFKKLGTKGANAEIYAGVFAGVKEPSSPLKYKLFTKFVSQLNFLGQQLEIGSFRFYHQNGKMNAQLK